MRIFKRVLAFFLAFACIVGSVPFSSIQSEVNAAETENREVDGTFESELLNEKPSTWTLKSAKSSGAAYVENEHYQNYALKVSTDEKNKGSKSMVMEPVSGAPGYVFAESDFISVTASTAYSFEYAMKLEMEKAPEKSTYFAGVKVFVRQYDKKGNLIDGTHTQHGTALTGETEWETYRSYIQTQPKVAKIKVLFFVGANNNYRDFALYVDDVTFEQIEKTTKLLNGDMEAGSGEHDIYSWHLTSKSIRNEAVTENYTQHHSLTKIAEGYHGNAAVVTRIGTVGYVSFNSNMIQVTENADYVLDFAVKVTDALANFRGIRTYLAEYNKKHEQIKSTALHAAMLGNYDWTERTYAFSVTEDTAYFQIEFWCGAGNKEPFKAYFDDVRLTTVLRSKSTDGVNNSGFEEVYNGSLLDWFIVDSEGVSVTPTFDGYNNTKGLKIARSGMEKVGNATIQSNKFKVTAGKDYKVNLMARFGDYEGSRPYIVTYCQFYDKKGDLIEKVRNDKYDHRTYSKEWVGGKGYYTAPKKAETCMLVFVIRGLEFECWMDDVTWSLRDKTVNAYGFDATDKSGNLIGWSVTQPAATKLDKKTYREGDGSLFVSQTWSDGHTQIVSDELIPVNPKTRYKITAYIKSYSCNISAEGVRLNALTYDKDGNQIGTIQGLRVLLNEDSEPSEWREMICGVFSSTDIAYIRMYVDVSPGTMNFWLDDLTWRVYDLNNEYWEDFDSVCDDGSPAGWSATTMSGNPTYVTDNSTVTIKNDSADDSGKITTKWQTAQEYTSFSYTTTYASQGSGTAKITIRYFDYRGKEVTKEVLTKELETTYGETVDYTFNFIYTSAQYALIELSYEGEGSITFDGICIVKQNTKEAETTDTTWRGKWIWHAENYKDSINSTPRYFRYHVSIPDTPAIGNLQITADDRLKLWVNGVQVVDENMSMNSEFVSVIDDIYKYMKAGDNVIAVSVQNYTVYAGLLFDGYVETEKGEWVDFYSSESTVSTLTEYDDWYKVGYDDSHWTPCQIEEVVGGAQWGDRSFDNSAFVKRKFEVVDYSVTEATDVGKTATLSMTIIPEKDIETSVDLNGALWIRNTEQKVLTMPLEQISGPPMEEWKAGKKVTVAYSFEIPDYIGSAKYVVQLDINQVKITNMDFMDNKFMKAIRVTNDLTKNVPKASIVDVNGTYAFEINGEVYPNMTYVVPNGMVYSGQKSAHYIHDSGICISRLWTRLDFFGWTGYGEYDWDAIDNYVYEALSDHPDTYLIITLRLDAPEWWKEDNPDEMVLDSTGNNSLGVSTASDKFVQDSTEANRAMVEHMKQQPYWNRVIGAVLGGYKTSEWAWYGNGPATNDFSPACQVAWKKWVAEEYKTDAALQDAWNDKSVTLDNVHVPTVDERVGENYNSILDPSVQKDVIDYVRFKGEIMADRLIDFAAASSEWMGEDSIIGAYYGYALNRSYYYQATNAMHTCIDRVLEDKNIDFLATPALYEERYDGEICGSMAMFDSALAHGKAVMLEDDLRTCTFVNLSTNFYTRDTVGPTYTVSDSVSQLERNFALELTGNVGNWWMNINKTNFDLKQFSDLIETMHNETVVNLAREKDSTGDVCYIIDETAYYYMAFNQEANNQIFYWLLFEQRYELGRIGVTVDSYYMSDLEKGLVSDDHKVYIMLSPIELDAEKREAVEKYLKKDDHVIIWQYLSGASDGETLSAENMSEVIGMDVKFDTTISDFSAKVTNANHWLTKGLDGKFLGATNGKKVVSPTAYVTDPKAEKLGYFSYKPDQAALAVKDMGDWTSIFSSVTCVPTEMIRNILKKFDVHTYSDNLNDVIYANSNYVGINCSYGGEKKISLDGTYAVYDVYSQETYSLSTDTIEFTMDDKSTKLFRLTPADKHVVYLDINSKGQSKQAGWNDVDPGDNFTCKVQAEDGYIISGIIVDGELTEVRDKSYKISLKDVDNSHFIKVQFKAVGEEEEQEVVEETSLWLTIAWVSAALLFVVVVIIIVLLLVKRKQLSTSTENVTNERMEG